MIRRRSIATSRWRSLVEPALVVVTVGALVAGGARVAGRMAWRSRRVLDRRHVGRAGARGAVGACGVAARTGRGGSDRGVVAGRHAARRRVPGGRVDRGDAGRRAGAGGGRGAPSLARLAGAARTRAAIRSAPDRLGGGSDTAQPRWRWTISWSWVPAKWCRWTGASSTRWPCWMNRCSPASRCRSSAAPASRSAAVWSTRATRSSCVPTRPRRTARTRASCGWPKKPERKARRSCGWPTGTPPGSYRWRC